MYTMKSTDLDLFYNYTPNTILFFVLWVLFWSLIGYHYGRLYFNHENFDKAYHVVGELIKRDIRSAEKEATNGKPQENISDSGSYFEDIKRFKHKWSKLA